MPAPYTSAMPPGGGGVRRIACSETENGSASTAASSLISSGIGIHCDSCAGTRGANPPVAVALFPVWMPGAADPRAVFTHCARSPSSHHSHSGTPRVAHESHGFSTTRSPIRRCATPGPTSSITPTTSCPSTCGHEIIAVIGLSNAPFMNTCL